MANEKHINSDETVFFKNKIFFKNFCLKVLNGYTCHYLNIHFNIYMKENIVIEKWQKHSIKK